VLVVQLMPPTSLASLQSGMVYLSVSGLARLLWKSGRRTGVVVCVTNYSGLRAVTICSALFLRYYRSSRTSRSLRDLELSFVPPGCRKQVCGLYALPLFLYFFNSFCWTSYPKIYRTDLCQMFLRVAKTTALDDHSEICFLIP